MLQLHRVIETALQGDHSPATPDLRSYVHYHSVDPHMIMARFIVGG